MLRIIGLVYLELTTSEGIRIGNPNADLVQDAIAYIRKHYAEKVELPALAARAGLSPKYFGTLFKRATGQSVSQFLLGLRLEEAKRLLRTNKHAIAEIADRVGIGDLFYFSKLFKKSEGLSPKKYAESIGYRHSPPSMRKR